LTSRKVFSKIFILVKDINETELQNTMLSGPNSVASISQVCVGTMLLLLMAGCLVVQTMGGFLVIWCYLVQKLLGEKDTDTQIWQCH